MEFLQGYLLGLSMIVFIGPVFFLLIRISLEFGTSAGVWVAIGIIISDILCVILSFLGVNTFFASNSKFYLTLLGGILLILLGLKYLIKPSNLIQTKNKQHLHYLSCFVKGFLVNFVNPFVFFVWIGVVTYAKDNKVLNEHLEVYFLGVLLGIFSTDLLKVFTSRQIKTFLRPTVLRNLYLVSGLVLVGFGLRLLLLLV
ncbi:MAG: LysE family transporter [Leptospiraceae bacterium]|nr:LysE family transporter [Leptospiraceae bacterium]